MAKSLKELLDKIIDPSQPLKVASLMALSDAGPAEVRLFKEIWDKVDVARRRKVVHWLVDIAEDNIEADFRAILRVCLGDSDPEVRATAIQGLWEDSSPTLADELVALLRHDPSPQVRAAAAIGLQPFALQSCEGKLIGDRPALIRSTLLAAFSDQEEDLAVRCEAIKSLAYWEDEEVRAAIAAAYRHEDIHMKASAIHAMGVNSDPSWRKTILAELTSPYPEIRYEAAGAAGEMELRQAVPTLIALLQDEDLEVRLAAVGALGMIGGRQARKALEQCLTSKDESLREAAMQALEELLFMEEPLAVPRGGIDVQRLGRRKSGGG